VPFFALFMATLRADPPVGDADALRRLGGSADLRYWVVHDLADAIDAAAAQTPLAIVLEDIHWADNATLLALRSLATARPDVPVLWVLTAPTGAGGPAVQETFMPTSWGLSYSICSLPRNACTIGACNVPASSTTSSCAPGAPRAGKDRGACRAVEDVGGLAQRLVGGPQH